MALRPQGDDDELTPEEVLAAIEGMDPAEAWQWLTHNADNMSEEAFNAGQESINQTAHDLGLDPDPEPNPAGVDANAAYHYNEAVDGAAEAGAQHMLEVYHTGRGYDEGEIDAYLLSQAPEDMSAAEQQEFLRDARDAALDKFETMRETERGSQGQDDSEASAGAEADVDQFTGQAATPRWMLTSADSAGYSFDSENNFGPDPRLQKRFLEYYNDLYGTDYSSFDMLVAAVGDQPTDQVVDVWNAALLGNEPTYSRSISLPGMNPVTLSQEDIDILAGTYGLSNDGITRLVRMAYMNNNVDPLTGQARPVDLYSLAAVIRGQGRGGTLADQQQRIQEIAQLQQELDKIDNDPHQQVRAVSLRNQITRLQQGNAEVGDPHDLLNLQRGSGPGVYGLRNQLYYALDRYDQNQPLAVLSLLDNGLASRIAKSGGDPEKLDPRDSARAWDLMIQAGVVERNANNGFRPDNAIVDLFSSYFGIGSRYGGGGGGGAGPVRRVLDEVAVKQQIDDFWQSMFREKADPSLVKKFASSLQKALDKSPQGQDFDATARIQDWLKGQSRYGELYGKRPEGVTDQEWQGQFIGAQQSILGNELPSGSDPVTLGMEAGNYQTSVGAAAGTKEAWGNSTWMEKLANAARVVAENT